MECVGTRIPYAKWRLNAFRQLLAISHAQAVSRGISTSRQTDQPKEAMLETKTGNSSPDTVPPSQRLPQSPLLTRSRHGAEKNRKRRPTKQEEADLLKNPWALMLASPPRMCSVTAARLPSALMGTWGLVRQPDSDKLYMMPVGLLQDSLQSDKTKNLSSSSKPTIPSQQESLASEMQGQEEDPLDESPIPTSPDKQTGRQLVLRIAELLPLLQSISVPLSLSRKGGKKSSIMRLLPFRWKHPQGPVTAHEEKKIIWSEDMPELTLRSMRGFVVKKLGIVLEKYKRVGTPNGVWRALDLPEYSDAALKEALGSLELFDRMECGGVLLLGAKDSAAAGSTSSPSDSLDSVLLPQTGSKVPVFDLPVLFSESDINKLRESHAQFQHTALFFRPEDKLGVDAMISLWKIKRLLHGFDPTRQ
ncbi:hypothetical protein E8E15_007479 [Penicillium rubens]|jgi:hypothetical protein|uniref:Uncharacterized protein n=1 Tax=Penicillium chrysogenum TaxID=5076 RepID=A0A167SBL6_PENCH|nr:uncharacterized protein N7525_009090 [Penicillium rubens]KAF3023920.1 hypothetical protein E8E15_007479 [Penicillium rubens]KAJ5047812.1 hypothetical protein NUH16_006308 [Penicillium rubens]KAJ5830837.1 hypothetical protein N7525_009090 [Penicillium rubens]KZN86991.1 hypothetical protein EN45_055450 [Penicillium chrysogenum]